MYETLSQHRRKEVLSTAFDLLPQIEPRFRAEVLSLGVRSNLGPGFLADQARKAISRVRHPGDRAEALYHLIEGGDSLALRRISTLTEVIPEVRASGAKLANARAEYNTAARLADFKDQHGHTTTNARLELIRARAGQGDLEAAAAMANRLLLPEFGLAYEYIAAAATSPSDVDKLVEKFALKNSLTIDKAIALIAFAKRGRPDLADEAYSTLLQEIDDEEVYDIKFQGRNRGTVEYYHATAMERRYHEVAALVDLDQLGLKGAMTIARYRTGKMASRAIPAPDPGKSRYTDFTEHDNQRGSIALAYSKIAQATSDPFSLEKVWLPASQQAAKLCSQLIETSTYDLYTRMFDGAEDYNLGFGSGGIFSPINRIKDPLRKSQGLAAYENAMFPQGRLNTTLNEVPALVEEIPAQSDKTITLALVSGITRDPEHFELAIESLIDSRDPIGIFWLNSDVRYVINAAIEADMTGMGVRLAKMLKTPDEQALTYARIAAQATFPRL